MKKLLSFVLIITIITSGCSAITQRENFEQNIELHYFEVLASQSEFLLEIKNINSNEDIKSLAYYVKGFQLSQRNRDTYGDVKSIAYKRLNETYSPETVKALSESTTNIDRLINKIYLFLNQDKVFKHEIKFHQNTINNISKLGLLIAPRDQGELSLYNIFVFPDHILNKYTDSEIRVFVYRLNELSKNIENDLEIIPN